MGALVFRLAQILGLVKGPEPGSDIVHSQRARPTPCRRLPQHSLSALCWDCFCPLFPHQTVSPQSFSSFLIFRLSAHCRCFINICE